MEYELRPMTVLDIDSVVEGEEKAFGESLGYDMLYSELVMNPFANYFVLDIEGFVRGYIGVWIDEDNSQIINFYVDEDYRGLGFGSMMLEFVIELCKMSNLNAVSLEVRESNHNAISLYEKYGFVFSHKRKHYYKDGEDALLLIKLLKEE